MKKQTAKNQKKRSYAAQTKTILKVEDKQMASWMLIGALLLAVFIIILTEI